MMPITIGPQIVSRDVTYELARDLISGVLIAHKATQIIWVDGLTAGGGAKAVEQAKAAALACASPAALESPSLPGLVLDHVTAHLWSCGTQAWVTALWINPTLNNSLVVDQSLESELDGGVINVAWVKKGVNVDTTTVAFTSNGRPNGTWLNGIRKPSVAYDINDPPSQYYRTVPIFRIIVPFNRTNSAVTAAVASRQGTVNADAVTWGGYLFPIKTLRFNSIKQRKYSGGGSDTFVGHYDFTARPDPWQDQDVRDTGTAWATSETDNYLSATFAGAFPAA